MTTVAFRDGQLCADTQASCGDILSGHVRKLFVTPHGQVALIGSAGDAHSVLRWIDSGAYGLPPSASDCMVIRLHDGKATAYANGHAEPMPDAPFWAHGSGRAFALGAMAHGATAEEAVRVAMCFDPWTGGEVERLRLDGDEVEVLR